MLRGRAPVRCATTTAASARPAQPRTLRLAPRRGAAGKADTLDLSARIFTYDAEKGPQRLAEMKRLVAQINEIQAAHPPVAHQHGPDCNHDHDHGHGHDHQHLNPEMVQKVRPLNARLVREFIKFPTWEVNGKSSPEGDQAVLLPSEAAQGYLLPIFTSTERVGEFNDYLKQQMPDKADEMKSHTIHMSGFRLCMGLLPALKKSYGEHFRAVLVDPSKDSAGIMQFNAQQCDELLELASAMYIERLLRERQLTHAHLQGFPLWVLKSEDGKQYITKNFEGHDFMQVYTAMDWALSFMYTIPAEVHEKWGWARIPYSQVLKEAGARNQGLLFNWLNTNTQEADDNMETLFLAPRSANLPAEKLKPIGAVITLDDAKV